jgi:hypothetical protein
LRAKLHDVKVGPPPGPGFSFQKVSERKRRKSKGKPRRKKKGLPRIHKGHMGIRFEGTCGGEMPFEDGDDDMPED